MRVSCQAVVFFFSGLVLVGQALAQAEPELDEKEVAAIKERHVKAAAQLQHMYGRQVVTLSVGDDGKFVSRVSFLKGELVNPALPLLPELFNVKSIYAPTARLVDKETDPLAKLAELEELQVYFTGFGDNTAKVISELPKLKVLTANNTALTDAGVAEIAKIPNLEILSLDATPVTDAALVHIANIEKLRGLMVTKTRITPAALARYKAAHPDVTEQAVLDFHSSKIGAGVGARK